METLSYCQLMQRCGELQAQVKQLAAENSSLKSGPHGFFAYGTECGYEEFDTAEKAIEFAENEIADFRGQACDGWSDEVGSVVWGVVMQRATMVGLRPVTEEDGVPSYIEEWCDYALLPSIKTPATDAILASLRAEGVEMFVEHCKNSALVKSYDFWMDASACAESFAAQLRSKSEVQS